MPEQEREINTIRGLDIANAQWAAPMRPEPTKERLDAPHQRVWVKNNSPNQNHIVIDRFNVGHELRPGERREMDMLNAEIANFQEHRRPGRFFPEIDPEHPAGKMKPLHPIEIEGVPEIVAAQAEPQQQRRQRGD
jgi:hypothetical protein